MDKKQLRLEQFKELNEVIKFYEAKKELSLQDRGILIILKVIQLENFF